MLCSTTFLTLDGVMSDPHVWHPAYASDESLALLGEQLDAADALLLGRRTYEGFAAYWPDQDDTVPLARRTNEIPKLVVTSSREPLAWTGASVLEGQKGEEGEEGGPMSAVERLKDEHDVLVPGGAVLLRSLLAAGLLDEMRFYIDPLVLGRGERLFAASEALPTVRLALIDQRPLPNGVQYLAYRPARGHPDG
jgi:dihydrofolate reductase